MREAKPEERSQTRPTPTRGSGRDPVWRALQGLEYGEGVRVGVLGQTGSGKTHVARALIGAYLTRVPGLAIVCDPKRHAGYAGQTFESAHQVRGLQPEPRVIVLRDGDNEAAARYAWDLVPKRVQVLLVLDEVNHGGRPKRGSLIMTALSEGRSDRLSVLWGTQRPQDAIGHFLSETDWVFAFRTVGLGVDNLRRKSFLVPSEQGRDPGPVLEALPGNLPPPPQRGDFLALRAGAPWDGLVYRL